MASEARTLLIYDDYDSGLFRYHAVDGAAHAEWETVVATQPRQAYSHFTGDVGAVMLSLTYRPQSRQRMQDLINATELLRCRAAAQGIPTAVMHDIPIVDLVDFVVDTQAQADLYIPKKPYQDIAPAVAGWLGRLNGQA